MNNTPATVAIIPARGGSKGLPRKNIYPLAGKPLIAYSVEAGMEARMVTATVVSSEDHEILGVAKTYGAEIVLRPDALASDTASCESVVTDALQQLAHRGERFDLLVLLQPTSPLRTAHDIDAALDQFIASGATSLISVYEPEHTPYKAFQRNNDGFLEGLVDNRTPFMRRQDLPATYMPNGAIYITKVELFLSTGTLFSKKTVPYIMSEEKSVDVDRQEDVARIEQLLQHP